MWCVLLLTLIPALSQAQQPSAYTATPHKTPPKAAVEFKKSLDALETGKIDKAIRHLRAGLAIDPTNADAYNDLGVIYFNTAQPALAIEAFTSMVAVDPSSFRGHVNLAYAFQLDRRYADSERSALRALEIQPDDPKAHFLLGLALSGQQKQLAAAVRHLALAVKEFPEARTEITRLRTQAGLRQAPVQ